MTAFVRIVLMAAVVAVVATGGFLIGARSYDLDRATVHHGVANMLPPVLKLL
jgi:hypothetical protein